MPYEFTDQARAEAEEHAPSAAHLATLAEQVTAVGAACGVLDHRIEFTPAAWGTSVTALLPDSAVAHCRISRGDVFDVAAQVLGGARPATDLFAASFVWGTGLTGYGPARYRDIADQAGDRLEPALQAALAGGQEDPIAGYAILYGGHDPTARAAPHQPPWARVHSYGPAFFTKLLYFAAPGALILDSVLAATVHRLSGIRHLVTARRRPVAWSPYRYAVYLHWMRLTAARLGVQADLLEYTLFQTRAVTAP